MRMHRISRLMTLMKDVHILFIIGLSQSTTGYGLSNCTALGPINGFWPTAPASSFAQIITLPSLWTS